jgi:PAS domain S-box-containing protein
LNFELIINMSKLLKILLIEDSEDDALLLLRELKRGGYEPLCERVETPEAMGEALGNREWEIVISDYVLPSFSGLDALEVLKATGLDLPFIIVSGNIGEDIAVGAMRAGAHDYIIKGNLARLVPAVERELRDAVVRRDRKQAEEALHASAREIHDLYNNAPCGYHSLDGNGVFVQINDTELQWLGYRREDVVGTMKLTDVLTPESSRAFEKNFALFKERGWIKDVEYELVRKDGTALPILLSATAVTDSDGGYVMSRATVYDITERRESEKRITVTNSLLKLYTQKFSQKEYLDAVVKLVRDWSGCRHAGMRIADGEGNIPYESCIGYDSAFLESERTLSLTHDQCACTRVVLDKPDEQDRSCMTPNGSFYTADIRLFIEGLPGERSGRYRGVCARSGFATVAVIPIRHRERTLGAIHLADEREGLAPLRNVESIEQMAYIIGEALFRFGIEAESARLAAAVESAAEAMVITDVKGVILYVNPAFEQITGYTKAETVGQTLHILDSGKQGEGFYHELRDSLKSDGVWRGRLFNKKKDGTLYLEECTYSPVRNPAGEVINYVSVKRDVTERIRLESIAESVNTMNNIGYVFSGVRHEIGNPINSAKMILSVLQHKLDGISKEAVNDYVNRTLTEIGRVEHLLKSLKNYNLFETPELENLNMDAFLKKFLDLVTEDFAKKGITITKDVQAGAEWALADPRALQQAMLNLVTNAVDALTDREGPAIGIVVTNQDGRVLVRISDNGCGMTEKQQKDLFKPFYTSKPRGTGLGLVIVKKMLTKMNGDIEITSSAGWGTTVSIELPEGKDGA